MIIASPSANSETSFYCNVADAAQAALMAAIAAKTAGVKIIVCDTTGECERNYAKLSAFLKLENSADKLYMLPKSLSAEDPEAFENFCERSGTANAMKLGHNLVVITTPDALIATLPEKTETFELKKDSKISIETLRQKLCDFGYYNEVLCEGPGQFAIRGGIVDVYPLAARSPYRIDFFGDEVDSIRPYDPDTQLSDGQPEKFIQIDSLSTDEKAIPAYEFISKNKCLWIFKEPARLEKDYSDIFGVSESFEDSRANFQNIFDSRPSDEYLGISSIEYSGDIFKNAKKIKFASEDLAEYRPLPNLSEIGQERYLSENALRQNFIKTLAKWKKEGYELFIEAEGNSEISRIEEIFKAAGERAKGVHFIPPFFSEGFLIDFAGREASVKWKGIGKNSKGIVCVGALEIFGRRIKTNIAPRRKILSRRAEVDALLDFSELSEGDYVVHLTHGICRFHGVVPLEANGLKQELIKLEFEDKVLLFLPLHRSHLLSRYIGLDKNTPKLSKLDSKSWIKIRTAAETAALDYAAELLDMQSKREVAQGYAFGPDGDWQKSFEDSFPFVETPDQLRSVDEVKQDMQSPHPMDRLICADVGFGKTEIALRAAFKAVMSGKQAAVLCPTTILCQQHFKTFKERFAPYPVIVEMASRFRKPREISKIKAQLKTGQIDLVIGTHALLANDVAFKDLGLLVIDEEHRFGVKHKEKIKGLKESVDVLTMSATPIPRTLYFAMMGAKTMSIMETPPKNRLPVETIVKEYSEQTVKEAVQREIDRGGQIFYLHNRVKTIELCAQKLRTLFPNLKIAVGHGQMDEKALEDLMGAFMDGKYDILVCTTIIESGLDISNCNTIIIEGADKFGLSQLYQLRGRVGRFTRKAYAYLFLHKHAKLVEKAHKRLSAIRQYNKPGAGFRIATRDLQLRGCGNLLGARQSGHIAGVGFDMYCSLLKQSIAKLKGEEGASGIRALVMLDFISLGEGGERGEAVEKANDVYQEIKVVEIQKASGKMLSAFIPEDYIPQTQLRIEIYRRIELCASFEEAQRIEKEMQDRYGKIPQSAKILFELAKIRIAAEMAQIIKVESEGAQLKLRKANSAAPDFVKLNGHFPRLTKVDSMDRLAEIQNFLRVVLPSIK